MTPTESPTATVAHPMRSSLHDTSLTAGRRRAWAILCAGNDLA